MVMWSLVHEMRISLIFPFILLSIKRYKWCAVLGFWLLSVFCTVLSLHITGIVVLGYEQQTVVMTFLDTGFFIVFFAAGAYLANERDRVARAIMGSSKALQRVILTIIICGFLKADYQAQTVMGSAVYYMRGIESVGLIALSLGMREFSDTLNHRVLIWLGRISYSLYLVHIPILYVINQTNGKLSVFQTSSVVIALSLVVAEAMVRLIERPSIELGKQLSAKLFHPPARAAAK